MPDPPHHSILTHVVSSCTHSHGMQKGISAGEPALLHPAVDALMAFMGLPELSSKRKERTLLTEVLNSNHTLQLYTAQTVPDPTKLDMPLSPTASHPSIHPAQSPKFRSGSKHLPNQMYLCAELGIFSTPIPTPAHSLPSSPASSRRALACPAQGPQPQIPIQQPHNSRQNISVPGISLWNLALCSSFCLLSSMSLPAPLPFCSVSNLALWCPTVFTFAFKPHQS